MSNNVIQSSKIRPLLTFENRSTNEMHETIQEKSTKKGTYTTLAEVIHRQKALCPPEPHIPSQTYNPEDFIKRQQSLLMEVTDLTIVEGAGKILSSSEPSEGLCSIMTGKTCDDLGLISGKNNAKKCLASEIDRTKTVAGRIFLYGRISRPTDEVEKVKHRQAVAKMLANEDKKLLLTALNAELEVLRKNEPHMLGFENSKLALPGRVDKLFLKYNIEKLDTAGNKNSLVLTANACIETSKQFVANTVQTAATVVLPLYALSQTGMLSENLTQLLKEYVKRFAGSSGPLYTIASLAPIKIIQAGMGLLGGAIASLSFKTNWTWFATDQKMELMLHKKMLAVARYFRSAMDIYLLLLEHPKITQNLEHFHLLTEFFENKELHPIFKAFTSTTFDSESNIFFQRGNVLFPWRQLEDIRVRAHFRKAITALAEIDTVLSVTQLIHEHTGQPVEFCFPTFLEQQEVPSVQLHDYWNPIVGKSAVPNSIQLGEIYAVPNIIITGPNRGGKSTSLRSIMSSVVLAQSLGIAPAKEMTFTPMSRITSSMQTTDNAQSGDSLFSAQTKCITELETAMIAAAPGEFGMNALDEIFTGTRQEEGEPLAKFSAQKLGNYRNDITMFATHFSSIPALESEPDSRYKNYKVTAQVDGDRVTSTFLLDKGISTQYLGLEIAEQIGLSAEIVQKAREARAKG